MSAIPLGGFSIFLPGFTTFAPAAPFGEGSSFDGAGSRLIFVSSSTGSDSNAGTHLAPFQTISHALTGNSGGPFLRNGYADWLLLLQGDQWTDDTFADFLKDTKGPLVSVSGGPPFSTPVTCMLIGSYYNGTPGSPAYAQINHATSGTDGTDNALSAYNTQGPDNLAVVGIHFYAYTRDPNSANLNSSDVWNGDIIAVDIDTDFTWLHFEDVHISYGNTGFNIDPGSVGPPWTPAGYLGIYRCFVQNCYGTGGTSDGYLGGGIQNFYNIESYFDANGWSRQFSQPVSITLTNTNASPIVVTWTGSSKFLKNGAQVLAGTSGGNLTAGNTYYVINQSGDTFEISASSGGSAIDGTGNEISPQNFIWTDTITDILLNRNLYCHDVLNSSDDYGYYPITTKRVLTSRSASEGLQQRPGGTIWDVLSYLNPTGINCGPTPAGSSLAEIGNGEVTAPPPTQMKSTPIIQNNVILAGAEEPQQPTSTPYSFGMDLNGYTSSTVTNNIIANTVQASATNGYALQISSSNAVDTNFTDNILFNWPRGISDSGDDSTTSPNTVDLTGSNTGGSPEPFNWTQMGPAHYMVNGPGQSGYATSTSSVSVGTGSKTFSVSASLSFVLNDECYIQESSNSANNMRGIITAVSSGSVTVNVLNANGSGTHSDWTIGTGDSFITKCFAMYSGGGWNTATNTWVPYNGTSWNANFAVNSINNWTRSGFNQPSVPALP
jgi:hypothetical protein